MEWILPLLSLGGTLIGSIIGILVSQKVVMFRLEQLERKMDKHNNLIERMVKVEVNVEAVSKRVENIENSQKQ